MPPDFNLDSLFNMDFLGDSGSAADAFESDPEVNPKSHDLINTSYEAKAKDLREQEDRAQGNAMDLLKQSLQKSADVSPEQGFAAALLAAIPSMGGYMIGKHVGTPNIPNGVWGVDLSKYNSGAAEGGQEGVQIGAQAAGGYLKSLDADQAQANSVREKRATIEENKANRLESEASSYDLAGMNKQAQEDLALNPDIRHAKLDDAQKEIKMREQSSINVANAKPNSQKAVEEELTDPAKKAAYDKVSLGKGTEQDMALLSPEAIKTASQNLRSNAYNQSVANTQSRFDTQQSYAHNNDTVVTSPVGNDPKLNEKRSEIIGNRNMALNAVNDLASSYDKTTGQFLGISRAKEAALASTLYTAARGLAGTGANLTQNEQPLVAALSAPQLDINGAVDYLHRYLTEGGDPAQITRTIGSVLDKAFNAKLSGYGQQFKSFADTGDRSASAQADPLGIR